MSDNASAISFITDGVVKLANNLTIKKFFKWILTIGITTAVVLYVYEGFFSHQFYYNTLDRKLKIIEKTKQLYQGDPTIDSLSRLKTVEIINRINPPTPRFTLPINHTMPILAKLLMASVLPFLIILSNINKSEVKDMIIGASIIMIISFLLSLALPSTTDIWQEAVIIIVGQLIFLFALTKLHAQNNIRKLKKQVENNPLLTPGNKNS